MRKYTGNTPKYEKKCLNTLVCYFHKTYQRCQSWTLPSLEGKISPFHVPPGSDMLHGWTDPSEPSQPLRRRRRWGDGEEVWLPANRRPAPESREAAKDEELPSHGDGDWRDWSWTFKQSRKTRRKRPPSDEMCVSDLQLNPDSELHHQGEFSSAWTLTDPVGAKVSRTHIWSAWVTSESRCVMFRRDSD